MLDQLLGQIPPVSKAYLMAATILMVCCSLEVVSPLSLYLNWSLVFREWQVWRLITCFLFVGSVGMRSIWILYIMILYCSNLEEVAFRSRSAEFLWMLIISAAMLLTASLFVGTGFFFSSALINVMAYIWARRNPHTRVTILLYSFRAPYMPWVHCAISLMIGWPVTDYLLGIAVGHVYYFFEDVYPLMPTSKGFRIFATPRLLKKLMRDEQ